MTSIALGDKPRPRRTNTSLPRRILPGFGITMGFTILYVTLIVLIPLSGLVFRSASLGAAEFWRLATSARAMASYRVSFGTSFIAAILDAPIGLVLAWTLTRYTFPGRGVIDALIDLPFALPTAVTGITLTTLYAEHGWVGAPLHLLGVKVSYTSLGIVVALMFIGLPFVIRTVQPILESAERELEEAAEILGANRWQKFRYVIFPSLLPAIVTGIGLSFARGVGEYGSVIFIAGNLPFKTEITPLLIMTKLEEYNYPGATALALVLLMGSFAVLLLFNILERVCDVR